MKISLRELKDLVAKTLTKQGYSSAEASVIQQVLLYAQLRGNNQGVVKLIRPGIPKPPDAKDPEIVKESPVSAFIDAHQTHAMLAITKATDIAIEKATKSGIAVIGVNGIGTSSGALGFYAKRIANAGLVGIVCSGSMETVAAEGSSEAIFGTNPLAIGMPSDTEPLVYDITTSAMAYFGVVEANTAGKKLPEGIAYDKEGSPTNEPAAVIDGGALKSFDGHHKGSGLSMMVQALTGPLMGAYFTSFGDMKNNWGGHFIMAVDPELFAGTEALKKGVTQMTQKVKSTRKLPGVEEIFVPGEKGNRLTQKVISSEEIELEENLYVELKKAAS